MSNPSHSRRSGPAVVIASAISAVVASALAAPLDAEARSKRQPREETEAVVEAAQKPAAPPLTMMVSLNKQRIYVYDQNGLVAQSRVSTGMPGYETPKGIYSIIQKKEEHVSNIYEGASMPYMQRLLQTGIAMHAGVVPGYPASHGCIRLPFDFAPKLFGMTTMNERVVVTPDVQAPVAFDHPLLFQALPKGDGTEPQALLQKTAASQSDADALLNGSASERTMAMARADRARLRESLVAAVETAKLGTVKAQEAIPATAKAADEARRALKPVEARAAELSRAASKAASAKSNSEKTLKALERQLAQKANRMRADQIEALRTALAVEKERIAPLTAAAEAALAEAAAAKKDVAEARARIAAADAARIQAKKGIALAAAAVTAAEKEVQKFDRQETNRGLPLSVLISAKTGKISIRQGWEMVAEAPVTIEDAAAPLGTHLFTATSWADANERAMKWTVASVGETNPPSAEAFVETDRRSKKAQREKKEEAALPPQTDPSKATAALSRIKVPEDMQMRIAELVKPGSTFIVSDYDLSRSETRPGTDLIVQMPEVVAKVSRPQRKRIDQEFGYESSGGGFFFFSSPPTYSKPYYGGTQRRRATVSPKWGSW